MSTNQNEPCDKCGNKSPGFLVDVRIINPGTETDVQHWCLECLRGNK